jgi:NTE family protein
MALDAHRPTPQERGDLAIAMTGGGALAAYQVGLLRHLADHYPDLKVPVLTGFSAGAVNAAALASLEGNFRARVRGLEAAWLELSPEQVYQVNSLHLLSRALRFGVRLLSGRQRPVRRPRSLLDTAPLRAFLSERFCNPDGTLRGIGRNLATGELRALAIMASSYTADRSVTWVQDHGSSPWRRGHRQSRLATLTIDHIMASTALPFVFPAVLVDGEWYGDGGMRLTAPFSPAIRLGGSRILSISNRFRPPDPQGVDGAPPYPPPAQIAGTMLNSLFLEHTEGDLLQVERINRLIEELPEERRQGLRPVALMVLHPSVDLGRLANDYEPRLPSTLRFLLRGLGTPQTRSNDLLSLLMFQADFIKAVIEIGRQDAERRIDEIADFLLQPRPVRAAQPGK